MVIDRQTSPVRFAAAAVAWSVGLFAVLRLPSVERRAVQWLIDVQRTIAQWYGAPDTALVVIDASCSGADVMALSMAFCFAYPARWRQRLGGALGAATMIAGLNTVRIGTLLAVADDASLLELLHVRVWPVVLVLAAVAYAFAWIAIFVQRRGMTHAAGLPRQPAQLRFVLATVVLLVLHGSAAPWTMTSATLTDAGEWTAWAGAGVLTTFGIPASAQADVLLTGRGAFKVTAECLLTPMLPLYLAAVLALPMTRGHRSLWVVAAVPIFLLLGVLRTLVLALPPTVSSSPLVLAHGFYQIVLGAIVVMFACAWHERRHGGVRLRSRVLARFAVVAILAAVAAAGVGDYWRVAVADSAALITGSRLPTSWTTSGDVQGALPLLPAFQVGLLTALAAALAPRVRIRHVSTALGLLALTQVALLVALDVAGTRWGVGAHPVAIRAWAVGVPVVLWWLCLARVREPSRVDDRAYRRFWSDAGDFPDLRGARSTELYRRDEMQLLSDLLPDLSGSRLLKTDLWDEAKNTRILRWAFDRGAAVTGVDLSEPIVRQARRAFDHHRLPALVGDVRRLPFADRSFDAVYSMGTIEHFAEYDEAIAELARVLKPGGRLVIGVPNRYDPFLRPALVAVLQRLDLYGYGYERSFSRRALRRLLARAGLRVEQETGILFLPGFLRMIDLLCHTRGWHRTGRIAASLVAAFDRLAGTLPRLKRHGYLLATLAVRPRDADPPRSDRLSVDARRQTL